MQKILDLQAQAWKETAEVMKAAVAMVVSAAEYAAFVARFVEEQKWTQDKNSST